MNCMFLFVKKNSVFCFIFFFIYKWLIEVGIYWVEVGSVE